MSTEATPSDFTRVEWNQDKHTEGVLNKNSTLALKTAIAVARSFDANCALRNPQKECTVPMFEPQELSLGDTLRSYGFFTDIHLKGIQLTKDLKHGAFSEEEDEFRERFAERSADGYYAVKFLQKGVYNSVHAASAAADLMMETKILMNLAPHPNCVQIYGVTAAGSDAFLSRGREGFFIFIDRISSTLVQRLGSMREEQQENRQKMAANGEDGLAIAKVEHTKLMERLEMALDIASALLFLSDRHIVFNLRPEKVGFDARYSRIKLCDFCQVRENGQIDQAPSLTKTDDIRTLAYTAPEVLCQAPVTVAADVYAYGFVIFEMLSLERPFDGMNRSEHFEKVVLEGERPPIPASFPKIVKQLVEHCWNSHLRPTMKRVYDTVEEVLLFQDDKPDLVPVNVILPQYVGMGKAALKPSEAIGEATKPRRTSGKESHATSESDAKQKKHTRQVRPIGGDKRPISRQGTQKTSNRKASPRHTEDANSGSDKDDGDIKPRERPSRKARAKKPSEGSHGTLVSENSSSGNLHHEDESEGSLHDILQPTEEDMQSSKKTNNRANMSMPAISAFNEDAINSRPTHNSFSATEQKLHGKRRTKKQ